MLRMGSFQSKKQKVQQTKEREQENFDVPEWRAE